MAVVGRNVIASGASGAIATPKMRLPTSPGVSVRHANSAWGRAAKLPPAPSHSTVPCQHSWLPTNAAGKLNITKCGIVMCQGWSSGLQAAPALAAFDVARFAVPVVSQLVDEAEPLPFGVGEIDAGHAARIGRLVIDAVEGECVDALRTFAVLPASGGLGVAPACGGIGAVELGRHRAIDVRRQAADQRIVGAAGQEDVVAFLDPRHIDGGFADERGQDDDDGNRPRPSPRRHARDSEDDHGNHQQRVSEEID